MLRKKKVSLLALFDETQMSLLTGLTSKTLKDTTTLSQGTDGTIAPAIQDLIHFITTTPPKKSEEMYCFIMYDIEDNKVRRLVAKYLEKKGCIRVQKSIFFAKLHRNMYKEVSQTLKDVQQAYKNSDSVLVLPVGEDMLGNLLVIGKSMEFELMTTVPHTFFF